MVIMERIKRKKKRNGIDVANNKLFNLNINKYFELIYSNIVSKKNNYPKVLLFLRIK